MTDPIAPPKVLSPSPPAESTLILADDLSGACDAGVFFRKGDTRVEVRTHGLGPLECGAELMVVNTLTRSVEPSEAAAVVRSVLEGTLRRLVYKKMDSTLHGNFGAEIGAILAVRPELIAVVCPAFPSMGRRLVQGELLMGEEQKPVGRNLLGRFRDQTSVALEWFGVPDAGAMALRRRVEEARARGTRIVVFDAVEEADLERLARLVVGTPAGLLPCGSTGLARSLGACHPPAIAAATGAGAAPAAGGSGRGTVAMVIGSRSAVTGRQIERARLDHGVRVEPLLNSPDLGSVLAEGRSGIWTLDLGRLDEEALARWVRAMKEQRPRLIVLSGGDTAFRVLKAAGMAGLRLCGELETGFPWAEVVGGAWDGLRVATKAGGFGDEATLSRCFARGGVEGW